MMHNNIDFSTVNIEHFNKQERSLVGSVDIQNGQMVSFQRLICPLDGREPGSFKCGSVELELNCDHTNKCF